MQPFVNSPDPWELYEPFNVSLRFHSSERVTGGFLPSLEMNSARHSQHFIIHHRSSSSSPEQKAPFSSKRVALYSQVGNKSLNKHLLRCTLCLRSFAPSYTSTRHDEESKCNSISRKSHRGIWYLTWWFVLFAEESRPIENTAHLFGSCLVNLHWQLISQYFPSWLL